MAYKSLNNFVELLERNGELLRCETLISTELEMTEIVDRISKSPNGGKAILFENNGTDFPVLMNLFGSEKRVSMALNVDSLNDIGDEIMGIFQSLTKQGGWRDKLKLLPKIKDIASFMPKTKRNAGICQEVVMRTPDLSKLPILKCWPFDGGKFITFPAVHTSDPETGQRNVGMYRMQVLDNTTTGMHWHKHKTGANHYAKYKAKGEKMPIAVTLGGDPAYIYAATAPMPENIDEYMLAGFLRKKKVEMVRCLTQNIMVPVDVDFVIEGYVDPSEELVLEGPFGDHTGFYSLADYYPKFHVTCITHRKDAIYPATVVGIPPMEDAWMGKATERIFLKPIQLVMLPEMIDMNLPFVGVAHNITIFSLKKQYDGQVQKAFQSLWGAGQMMFNKSLIAVDEDVNVHDYNEVLKTVFNNTTIEDWFFSFGPTDVLDHASSKFGVGTKLGIDATRKEKINDTETVCNLLNTFLSNDEIKANYLFSEDIMKKGIPLIVMASKDDKKDFDNIMHKLDKISGFCCIVMVDREIDLSDFDFVAWYCSGNIDPQRDIFKRKNAVFIDGSRKHDHNGFERDWPNITVSDRNTIANIDEKWENLKIGDFIASPSQKYNQLVKNSGAVFNTIDSQENE